MPLPPHPLPDLRLDDITRLRNRIEEKGEAECWPWIGSTRGGYGRLKIRGKKYEAKRLIYKLHYGEDPYPLYVCHTCDNPPCCNPNHLFKGTHQANIDDCVKKGRKKGPSFERSSKRKLTREQVVEIRRQYNAGEGGYRTIGTKFGITFAAVAHIIKRRSCKSV